MMNIRYECRERVKPPVEAVERGGHPFCMLARWHYSGWFCSQFVLPCPNIVWIGPDMYILIDTTEVKGESVIGMVGFRVITTDCKRGFVPLCFTHAPGTRQKTPFALRLDAQHTEKLAELVEHGALDFMLGRRDLDPAGVRMVARRLRQQAAAIRESKGG